MANVDDDSVRLPERSRGSNHPSPGSFYRDPVTLTLAGLGCALLSMLSPLPSTLAVLFTQNATFNSMVRAQYAFLAVFAAVGFGLVFAAVRSDKMADAPAWVRPLATAVGIITALVIMLSVFVYWLAFTREA